MRTGRDGDGEAGFVNDADVWELRVRVAGLGVDLSFGVLPSSFAGSVVLLFERDAAGSETGDACFENLVAWLAEAEVLLMVACVFFVTEAVLGVEAAGGSVEEAL